MAKVTVTQGVRKKSSLKAGATKQALSQKISHQITTWDIGKEQLDKLAAEGRRKVVTTAKSHYSAAVLGAVALINQSTVPAQYQEPPRVDTHRYLKRKKGAEVRGRYERGVIEAVVMTQDVGLVKSATTITPSSVTFTVQWKKLTKRYFKRRPVSVRFFRKRQNGARSALNAQAIAWRPKLQATASYHKGNLVWRHEGKSLIVTIPINYPKLGQFDFIRVAFLHGMSNTSTFPNGRPDNTGANGIIYAEHFRSFMRPYAVEIGRKFKTALENLD